MNPKPRPVRPVKNKAALSERLLSIYAFDVFLSIYIASRSLKLACTLACLSSTSRTNPFGRAMAMIRNGCPPQEALLRCAPSDQIGSEWLEAVVMGGGTDLASLQSEICAEMMKMILKAEDTMAFVIAASTLFPVVLSIAAILWGFSSSPWVFSIVLAQVSVFVVVQLWFKDLIQQI
ncbi:MAG: hypothetical protein NO516_01810 [Candidatus Methanomethylicia archaeon]|nr:hypothetical protein [Candidatus Methanomethylicia archaeon]